MLLFSMNETKQNKNKTLFHKEDLQTVLFLETHFKIQIQ